VSDFAAKAFVLALAVAAAAIIGFAGVLGDEAEARGGRWRRFAERLRTLGSAYSGLGGERRDPPRF
jgi:hypothetical protein